MSAFTVRSKIWLEADGHAFLGDGRYRLLEAVERKGSINAAAREMGISYRKAWSQLQAMEGSAPFPLLVRKVGGVGYYHRIAELTPPLGRGIYAGASLEAGRIFDTEVMDASLSDDPLGVGDKTRYSGSLFLAADTWLGPFYLGWGLSGEGDSSFHLLLGRP